MQLTAKTSDDFYNLWHQDLNFMLDSELCAFEMEMPSAEEIVDVLRKDPDARVQFLSDELSEFEQNALAEEFKSAKIEKAAEMSFALAHFYLRNFYGVGQFLQDFQKKVMIPWRMFLTRLGFTWQRCYPIIFISGKGCSSTYHVDISHVLAWQVHGTKHFNGFQKPEEVLPIDKAVNERNDIRQNTPPEHDVNDVLPYAMQPGDLLWNQLLTPHWVVAGDDEIAVSVNISHGGVSYAGAFCPREHALRKRWEIHPDEAWLVDERY
ncbi:MAG: YdeI/OmpD-associated family protein [Candidatus Latescibacteria bacterium]|jgi:hypothetical protein|nr:YdeI/OmpD-associated family protein [Candidatus Latescibacterota bacterium]MBT4137930.1 YdeI/OmpD-associated family protein [Candidatus Latescibacterota bacterium]MBT5831212.1 YdeI/OmpD-associated family protein [Candidatus Latescibacterota bacterium]